MNKSEKFWGLSRGQPVENPLRTPWEKMGCGLWDHVKRVAFAASHTILKLTEFARLLMRWLFIALMCLVITCQKWRGMQNLVFPTRPRFLVHELRLCVYIL